MPRHHRKLAAAHRASTPDIGCRLHLVGSLNTPEMHRTLYRSDNGRAAVHLWASSWPQLAALWQSAPVIEQVLEEPTLQNQIKFTA